MTTKKSNERFEEWSTSLPFKIKYEALPTHIDAWQAQEAYYAKMREENERLKKELEAWQSGKITEEMLRKNDGYLHVGNDCEIAFKGTTKELEKAKNELKDIKNVLLEIQAVVNLVKL